jgi:hypothetical protein
MFMDWKTVSKFKKSLTKTFYIYTIVDIYNIYYK